MNTLIVEIKSFIVAWQFKETNFHIHPTYRTKNAERKNFFNEFNLILTTDTILKKVSFKINILIAPRL